MTDEIKNEKVARFLHRVPDDLTVIRSVLLFGRNTYSYKFPFCEALLQVGTKKPTGFKQEDIFEPFLNALLSHVKHSPKQYIGGDDAEPSKFMKLCREYVLNPTNRRELEDEAAQVIPKNVFDAFQRLGGGELREQLRLYEFDKSKKLFTLTDTFSRILSVERNVESIRHENEARWRVVEEAWKVGISPGMVALSEDQETLVHHTRDLRIPLNSARDALLPYQKGYCFYCRRKLDPSASSQSSSFPDVDHFFPIKFLNEQNLQGHFSANFNGLWNLVIACKDCNRGTDGKFTQIPEPIFFNALVSRNEYFAEEHKHLFRFAILHGLGATETSAIRESMQKLYGRTLTKYWRPRNVAGPALLE